VRQCVAISRLEIVYCRGPHYHAGGHLVTEHREHACEGCSGHKDGAVEVRAVLSLHTKIIAGVIVFVLTAVMAWVGRNVEGLQEAHSGVMLKITALESEVRHLRQGLEGTSADFASKLELERLRGEHEALKGTVVRMDAMLRAGHGSRASGAMLPPH
jgi:hypothetical protein